MLTLLFILQLIIAVGLINVWVIRFNRPTEYRGGNANSMLQEFAAYGLSSSCCYLIGAIKLTAALVLLLGVFYPQLIIPAATTILILMVGAIVMHLKVKDPIKKVLPAIAMFLMSAATCYIALVKF